MDATRTSRLALVALATLAALIAFAAAAVPRAEAGRYHAFVCRIPYGAKAGTVIGADNVVASSSAPFMPADNNCGRGGGLFAGLDGQANHHSPDTATQTFTAPAGTSISAFTLWRYEQAPRGNGANATPVSNLLYTGVPSVDGLCAINFGCTGRGAASPQLGDGNKVGAGNLSGVSSVQWSAACGGDGACNATGAGFGALYEVYAGDFALDDPSAPTVANATGPLLAGGTLNGAPSVTFSATDSGSGVYRAVLVVDGKDVASAPVQDGSGNCTDLGASTDGLRSFAHVAPCPQSATPTVALDTASVPAGPHTLQVVAEDAAGNRATVANTTVATARAGTPNGTTASRSAKISVRYTTTKRKTRGMRYHTRPTIAGLLRDEAKRPIAGAQVAVLARLRRAGAPRTVIGTVATGGDGRFRYKLGGGPSRTVTFAYTAFSGDPQPATQRSLRTAVRARVTASLSRRSVGVGRPLRVRGRLVYLPRARVRVDIQARDGKVWRPIGHTRTTAKGRYTFRYRFKRTARGRTFRLRALVSSPLYPFATGHSSVRRVHVGR